MWTKRGAVALLAAAAAAYSSPPSRASPGNGADKPPPPPQISLAGAWRNDLGSEMHLQPPDEQGRFSGTYLTKVSRGKKPVQVSPLLGLQNVAPGKAGKQPPTFGFTVGWTFSDSIAVFVGQHLVDAAGEESLQTLWLLREREDALEDDWSATRVGRNVFKRIQ